MNSKTFVSSIPKAGTHLLASVINLIHNQYPVAVTKTDLKTFRFDKYAQRPCLMGHLRVNNILKNKELKSLILSRNLLILKRDPRDIVSSMVKYLSTSPNIHHQLLSQQLIGKSYQEKIILAANGLKLANSNVEVANIRSLCAGFEDFSAITDNLHILKYEDFFDGEIVKKIAAIFNLSPAAASILVTTAMAGDTKTKSQNSARAYAWRSEFNQELKDFFVKEYSDVILSLGYNLY